MPNIRLPNFYQPRYHRINTQHNRQKFDISKYVYEALCTTEDTINIFLLFMKYIKLYNYSLSNWSGQANGPVIEVSTLIIIKK